jgi:hypothetical protein
MKVLLDQLQDEEANLQKRRILQKSKGSQSLTRGEQNPW